MRVLQHIEPVLLARATCIHTSDLCASNSQELSRPPGHVCRKNNTIGSITKFRVDTVDIALADVPEKYGLTEEASEGVLGFSADNRIVISASKDTAAWENLPSFLHSGPLLLVNGVRQPLGTTDWNHVRNPRTVVCGLADNPTKAALITVDGRYPPTSAGMTLPELVVFLQALGCRDAINLDGGGVCVCVCVGVCGLVSTIRVCVRARRPACRS